MIPSRARLRTVPFSFVVLCYPPLRSRFLNQNTGGKLHQRWRIDKENSPKELITMADTKKCAHPACTCMTDQKYCSTHCESHKDTAEIACECGHPGCQGEIKK